MAPALVLTSEKAAEHGFSGAGPFVFAGVFPGVYVIDAPLAISELGFAGEDEARDRFAEVFGSDDDAPLEWTDVAAGEGLAVRHNHAVGLEGLRERVIDDAVSEETGVEEPSSASIRSHADADAIGERLGISFAEGTKLADKVAAIEEYQAGAAQIESDELELEAGDPGAPEGDA